MEGDFKKWSHETGKQDGGVEQCVCVVERSETRDSGPQGANVAE